MLRSLHIFILLIAVTLPNTSCAASFDCTKVGTDQEKMICSDSTLSSLDDKLSETYKSTLLVATNTKAAEIQASQKAWLRNIRSSCTSKACLVQVYEERISELNLLKTNMFASNSSCPVSEEALMGPWEQVSGGIFEEMSFDVTGSKRVFNSWLHQSKAGYIWRHVED